MILIFLEIIDKSRLLLFKGFIVVVVFVECFIGCSVYMGRLCLVDSVGCVGVGSVKLVSL